jgi:DNA helicase-2/ATP-dependent DNA helicase PcrA
LLPHSRAINSNAEIEEERRLFYVGMTRAKKRLVLSRAVYRRTYGEERLRASIPSRFLKEIPPDMIETAAGSQSDAGESRRYEPDPEYNTYYSNRSPRTPYGASARTQKPAAKRESSQNSLIGRRVRHAHFGVGTIIGVDGEGEDRRLTISFQDHGPKKLIERYANLQLA